jgi:hypothetical protein
MDGGGAGRDEVGAGAGRVVVCSRDVGGWREMWEQKKRRFKGSGQAWRCCCLTGSGLAATAQGFAGNERTARLSRGKRDHHRVALWGEGRGGGRGG